MTCLDEDTALALVNGELSSRTEIDEHLDRCPWCRRLFAEISSDGPDEPEHVGRFVIERELGQGATGTVYAARDPELDREVALKLLHDAQPGDALMAEAKLMAKLAHPNVVPVYEIGRHDDAVFVAMELVDGGTLREWLGVRHARAELLSTICGAGHGLAAAHELGLVHRDVKPENILVGRDGRARVSDFGLAASAPEAARVGTPAYMAPEQLRGGLVDARSDQFGFCVVLYEALYGERPFTGMTVDELLAAIERGPKQRGNRVLVRGLSADPAARFPSMTALLARLERTSLLLRSAAAAVTLCAAIALVLAVRHEDRCPDVSIAQPIQIQTLRGAFAHAGDAYDRAAAELERYAAAWSIAHHDACVQTERREASPALLDHRMRCLEDRRIAYRALVGLLAEPSAIPHATTAIGALQAPASCLDPDTSEDALAFAPEQQAEAAQLRTELARTEAAVAVGAKPDFAPILARAEALHLPRLRASALYLRAEAHLASREDADATADLEDASYLAEANRLDRLAARAASLAVAAATDASDYAAAHRWARSAEAALARAGELPADKAALASRLAWLDLHEAKLARAETEALAAIADGCRGEVATVATCAHFDTLATVYFAQGKYPDALTYYQKNLALLEQQHGARHPLVAVAAERVGNAYVRMGKTSDALPFYERALQIRGADRSAVTAQLHDNYGTALMSLHRLAEAESQIRLALAIHERTQGPDHPDLAATLVNLANVLDQEGKPEVSLRERALKLFEAKLGPDHPLVAQALVSIGWHYVSVKQPTIALPYLERALKIQTAALGAEHPDTAYTLAVLGSAQQDAGNYKAAIATFEAAIANKGTSPDGIADLKANLAETRKAAHLK